MMPACKNFDTTHITHDYNRHLYQKKVGHQVRSQHIVYKKANLTPKELGNSALHLTYF